MTEAQQEVINRSPEKLMMTLSFDRSVGQFRRLMTGLIEDEAKPRQAAQGVYQAVQSSPASSPMTA
jgi:hypothetical protein